MPARPTIWGASPSTRQLWQTGQFADFREADVARSENAYRAYVEFILPLYHATPISGRTWKHGVKSGRMVHVGDVSHRGQGDRSFGQRRIRDKVDSWREGWDVRSVTAIVGLRPYTAKANIPPEQTIGRGPRQMFRAPGTRYTERVDAIGNQKVLEFVEQLSDLAGQARRQSRRGISL